MKKDLTELVFILDKSGSMGGLERDTIGGYNAMLEKQRAQEGECRITTVLFADSCELLHDRIDIRAVSPITDNEYSVGGSTALFDAIGTAIRKICSVQKHTEKEYRADKVMFVIITDGEENASREYTAEKIRAQISRQKEQFGWEFVFLGANIDAAAAAGKVGISADRAADYLADGEGTRLNFEVMSAAVSEFRSAAKLSERHLERIRSDAGARGGQKANRKPGIFRALRQGPGTRR